MTYSWIADEADLNCYSIRPGITFIGSSQINGFILTIVFRIIILIIIFCYLEDVGISTSDCVSYMTTSPHITRICSKSQKRS